MEFLDTRCDRGLAQQIADITGGQVTASDSGGRGFKTDKSRTSCCSEAGVEGHCGCSGSIYGLCSGVCSSRMDRKKSEGVVVGFVSELGNWVAGSDV